MQRIDKVEEDLQLRGISRLTGIKSLIGRLQISVMKHHSARSSDVESWLPNETTARLTTEEGCC